MDDSRRIWAIAGLLGTLAASAVGILRLAQSEYRLIIRVTDAQGPLEGVWVAVGERDILSTNSAGYLEVRGARHELSSALVTVTDAHVEGRHLSQSVLAEVSWNPFQTESVLQVKLPVVDSKVELSFMPQPDADDLIESEHKQASLVQNSSESLLGERIDELELADDFVPRVGHFSKFSLLTPDKLVENESAGSLVCLFSGLSSSVCHAAQEQVPIPLFEIKPPKNHQLSAHSFAQEVVLEPADSTIEEQPESNARLTAPENTAQVSRKGVTVAVFNDGMPLSGARVYMSRQKDSRVISVGRTSSNGVVATRVLPQFLGERFTVVHECCAPKSFSARTLPRQDGKYKISLERGVGFAVLVQQSAYGYLRSTSAFELHGDNGKLAVSEQDSLAFYDAAKMPQTRLQRVVIRNGLPSEHFLSDKSVGNQLTHVLMAGNDPFIPSLALIESEDGQFHKGVLKSSYLRRWRRDFMARLMQLQTIRTQVSGETEARLKLASLELNHIRKSGWKQTPLASEWDFALSINYSDKDETLELHLTDRNGTVIVERKVGAEDALPERASRSHFEELVEKIPFEAYVMSEAEGEIELSFTQKKSFGLKKNSRFALYSHELLNSENLKTELIGFAELTDDESEGLVKAKITHLHSYSQAAAGFPPIVRAVKVGQDFFSSELKKNSFAALKKDSL